MKPRRSKILDFFHHSFTSRNHDHPSNNCILMKTTLRHPISTSLALIKLHKSGYLLLFLAILSSLGVFLIGLSPILHCTSSSSDREFEIGAKLVSPAQCNSTTTTTSSTSTSTSISNVNGVPSDEHGDEFDDFWEQPDSLGYAPCLNFSEDWRRLMNKNSTGSRNRFLIAVVSGGLNQQKNQIADAAVMARVLGASLVVPVLAVDSVWGDESEFSDIFDDRHFKNTLRDDVRVVSSLPVKYLRKRPWSPVIEAANIDEQWLRSHYMEPLRKSGVMIVRAFDSKLSKDLSPDLQKLRCKVVFKALKFRDWIEEVGDKLAKRMASGGPYLGLHLRLEKDVWVRTGCSPGLGPRLDSQIDSERASRVGHLKSRFNITSKHERYLAGLCPLNATHVARLLKGLGAPNNTRIYWAGGVPFGGEKALGPLKSMFPNLYNKWDLAKEGELDSMKKRSSVLAAIDYLVCLKSHVFMANHGGNMNRALQGHRAFLGHRKHISPKKKQLVHLFMNATVREKEMESTIRTMHLGSMGSPVLRIMNSGRDVIAYPAPECMCSSSTSPTK
ncbi:hypothetical protein Scep_028823 [Stephania cephalantha]|uniref:O-fucosyltransferase family protein n=1 Tax=Stephania cephalantha TaxID=152367 RepID=A0AAP0EAM9_9MAGN